MKRKRSKIKTYAEYLHFKREHDFLLKFSQGIDTSMTAKTKRLMNHATSIMFWLRGEISLYYQENEECK